MDADDKLAEAHKVIKQQADEIAMLKISRDGYMNAKGVAVQMVRSLRRQIAKLEADLRTRPAAITGSHGM